MNLFALSVVRFLSLHLVVAFCKVGLPSVSNASMYDPCSLPGMEAEYFERAANRSVGCGDSGENL